MPKRNEGWKGFWVCKWWRHRYGLTVRFCNLLSVQCKPIERMLFSERYGHIPTLKIGGIAISFRRVQFMDFYDE